MVFHVLLASCLTNDLLCPPCLLFCCSTMLVVAVVVVEGEISEKA